MLKKVLNAALFSAALFVSPLWADGHDHGDKVNINTASAEVLDEKLKYVGEKTAEKIVEYRKEHGEFKSVDDLSEVRGVGTQIIKANKDVMVLE